MFYNEFSFAWKNFRDNIHDALSGRRNVAILRLRLCNCFLLTYDNRCLPIRNKNSYGQWLPITVLSIELSMNFKEQSLNRQSRYCSRDFFFMWNEMYRICRKKIMKFFFRFFFAKIQVVMTKECYRSLNIL